MSMDNFAILLAPCIFRSNHNDPLKELLDTKKLVAICKIMLYHY